MREYYTLSIHNFSVGFGHLSLKSFIKPLCSIPTVWWLLTSFYNHSFIQGIDIIKESTENLSLNLKVILCIEIITIKEESPLKIIIGKHLRCTRTIYFYF
jgi:hypothetical protein